jgi:4-hydroxy-tetrahydrodipicolinate synthase
MFTGTYTALATPMREGQVDYDSLMKLVEFQISAGIGGLVPCGTTGEAATLSMEERSRVIRTTVDQARRRIPIIAGVGANSTRAAVENGRIAAEAGVDGLLHVTPYYNKPGAAGLVAHFRALAAATDLPILLYNVPGRTGCDMEAPTVAQLAAESNIVGIKEATGSIVRAQQIIASCPQDFVLLSGEDTTALAVTLVGGRGVISVVANVAPLLMTRMIEHAREGRVEQAREINYRLLPLMEMLFMESNPIPVKAALALAGYGDNDLRLPLVPLSKKKLELVRGELERQGILP